MTSLSGVTSARDRRLESSVSSTKCFVLYNNQDISPVSIKLYLFSRSSKKLSCIFLDFCTHAAPHDPVN